MAHTEKHSIGTSWHVQNCQVWVEIQYLDSPTDYREYLPKTSAGQKRIPDKLIFLDSPKDSSSGLMALGILIVGLWLLISGGHLLYVLLDRC